MVEQFQLHVLRRDEQASVVQLTPIFPCKPPNLGDIANSSTIRRCYLPRSTSGQRWLAQRCIGPALGSAPVRRVDPADIKSEDLKAFDLARGEDADVTLTMTVPTFGYKMRMP